MPETWAADVKKLGLSGMPIADANNPYIAAFVAAATMAKGKIGTSKNDKTALADIIENFENPGGTVTSKTASGKPSGAASDWSRGVPFLAQLETDTKTKGPKIKADTDALLLSLVTSAQKHGKDFSKATDDELAEVETYLKKHKGPFTTAGQELMQGLEQGLKNEMPALNAEAKSIADQLESTLRAALKTHSPSEMTAEIGADLMAGLGMGMQRGTSEAAGVAAGAAVRVAAALGTGGPTGSATPFQQTIIVQLDGREIGRVVQREIYDNIRVITKVG
jgi:hypothetical protein